MEIPPSLERSVHEIEEQFGESIESLVVPLRDAHIYTQITRKPLNRKIAIHVAVSRKKPLVTLGVADCNALVLINDGAFALFHEYPSINPESYLPRFFDKLKSKNGGDLSTVKAIQVAGDNDIFLKIKDILDDYKILIVSSYKDYWNVGQRLSTDDLISGKKSQKNIFVFPESKRVVMQKTTFPKMLVKDYTLEYKEIVLYDEKCG